MTDKSELEREVWEEFKTEHYEAVEMLPLQLRRQSSLIRELDEQGKREVEKVAELLVRYKALRERLARGEHATGDGADGLTDTRSLLSAIGQALSEYVRTSEEKLSISNNAYDSVDRHVRAMDVMIKEQEDALALGARTTVFGFQGYQNGTSAQQNGVAEGLYSSSSPPLQLIVHDTVEEPTDQSKLRIDMPIDPNEPVYCYCRSVSYGAMVACDDDDCPHEWFHLSCTGLDAVPKSKKWYCDVCKPKHEQTRRKK
ncbi:hypothetical protein EXIGLDRAFT_62511 [Exidia glandulosa HHB12029]|uniref:Chromatin modification-related protein n=1 Tax=Exidia glandulosa HHB12029 TaxID=1314781 RepID=A0A166ML28_EXIGL|nr:hypothetical protein EXIGLDRAFT_62511 [Exidia glandulosa HHB12029]